MTERNAGNGQRLLIYTPYGRDADHLCRVLSDEGFDCVPCRDTAAVVENLKDHAAVGAILSTEEALASKDVGILLKALENQPTWSAIPILAFYSQNTSMDSFQKKASHPLHSFTDVNFLQRPVTTVTLLAAVRAAIRDRQRQYRTRELLQQLESDIQQREEIERELKAATVAAEHAKAIALDASQSKSQFLANMSHEIRTPLGAITGFLDLMKSPSNSAEDLKEYIAVIERNSVQLMRVIDDILDLSKVEAGKLLIEDVEVSLAELLWDVSALLGFKAREKGVLYSLKFNTPIPERIISDATRIRQILVNVLGNAIKFTSAGRINLDVYFEDETLGFVVTDSGKGISLDEREHLFKPFMQADLSTTRKFGGTGLGLVLTRNLCRQMGGDFVLVQSQPGRGSTFKATVKTKIAPGSELIATQNLVPRNPPTQIDLEAGHLNGMRVLVVEDSPDNQALLSILLKKMGAEIDLASDGREGVANALSNDYDIVLMDVQMPFMDGHEATRTLRAKGYTAPIIALTAHAMKEERDRTIASGFSDFLSKPIDRAHLVRVLSEYRPHADP